MDTRRDFIKKAALLSGGAGVLSGLPPSIQKAFAINPEAGSTYLDAEHIVFLMQENRSFDHFLGWLPGARGQQAGLSYLDANDQAHSTYPLAPDYQG